jgi:hypothetical protein
MSWPIIILLNISFYNMLGNAFAAGVPPLFGLLIEEFHCTTNEASRLATYALLMLGVAVSQTEVLYSADLLLIIVVGVESLGTPSCGICWQEICHLDVDGSIPRVEHLGRECAVLLVAIGIEISWGFFRRGH